VVGIRGQDTVDRGRPEKSVWCPGDLRIKSNDQTRSASVIGKKDRQATRGIRSQADMGPWALTRNQKTLARLNPYPRQSLPSPWSGAAGISNNSIEKGMGDGMMRAQCVLNSGSSGVGTPGPLMSRLCWGLLRLWEAGCLCR
jgi:hypothetical protein